MKNFILILTFILAGSTAFASNTDFTIKNIISSENIILDNYSVFVENDVTIYTFKTKDNQYLLCKENSDKSLTAIIYYEYDTHGKYSVVKNDNIEKVSSVGECIDRAWKACQGDTGCSMTCAATGPACPAAIALACIATES